MSPRPPIPRWDDVYVPSVGSVPPPDSEKGAGGDTPDPAHGSESRPVLSCVHVQRDGLEAVVDVTLRLNGRELHATRTAGAASAAILRTVAAATLDAAAEPFGGDLLFDVESVTTMSGQRTAWVLVEVARLRQQAVDSLAGVARIVADDTERAAARAALDAVNRGLTHPD